MYACSLWITVQPLIPLFPLCLLQTSGTWGSTPAHLQLGTGLPDRKTSGGKSGECNIIFNHPQHRSPSGLCPKPFAVLLVHQ